MPPRLSLRAARTCLLALAVALTVTQGFASRARAYCRENVKAQAMGACSASADVPDLFWTRSCMTYVFNDQLVSRLPLLSEKELRDGFNESFATWQAVDCGKGRKPFYVEQTTGFTTTDKAEFLFDVMNESVIMAKTRDEWATLDQDANALALTLLWHDRDTGEILDVDMELNTGAGRFANCDKPCGRDMMDLRNTITHEAGHVLGLGHSTVQGATMFADAPDGETQKRTLEPDDELGYCKLDLPEFTCPDAACQCPAPEIYPSKRTVKSCACTTAGAGGSAPVMGLGLLVGLVGIAFARGLRRRKRS